MSFKENLKLPKNKNRCVQTARFFYEKKGIGKMLHDLMLDWYFSQTNTTVWLGTSPNTRAEGFYKKAGWVRVGHHGPDEIKFEMTYQNWKSLQG